MLSTDYKSKHLKGMSVRIVVSPGSISNFFDFELLKPSYTRQDLEQPCPAAEGHKGPFIEEL